ncbi:globin domain-containing protein [Anderseniella sp. Alg231-50]|uniref:globin domain-containing protein n=1 Tax=Anderseniella sp. Alg231-50 TaxID=1922226 RepID=UPI000D556D68
MNKSEIELIRETWAQVVPIADAAAQLFYQRLFEIDPDAKSLFANTDMSAQNEKLVDTLSLVVGKADQLDTIVPVLQELGRKHLTYGVEDRHYDSVGSALLWTLGQGLGEGFTDQARAAWTVAYALVSGPMRQAVADGA